MIVVYPALASSTVSNSILPGICKVLEKYVIIYKMDEIAKQVSHLNKVLTAVTTAGSLVPTSLLGRYARVEEQEAPKAKVDMPPPITRRKARINVSVEPPGGAGEVRVSTPKLEASISVEPTWIMVTTAHHGPQVVGVKVIPFPVKSDQNLAKMLLNDRVRYGLSKAAVALGRGTVRTLAKIAKTFHIPFIAKTTVVGDPRRDILYGLSKHTDEIFVVINYLDLSEEDFFRSTVGVKKLFKLGWSSLVITDEVEKRAIFCMKEFDGLCSSVPYGFIYSSLGKEQHEVFRKLEDVKAAASPFFKLSTSLGSVTSKAVSEAVVSSRIQHYIELL